MIFIFFDPNPNLKSNLSVLINFMILKTSNKPEISLYLINKTYQKDFLEVFKLKKLLCFSLMLNEFNSKVVNEIQSNTAKYNCNSNSIVPFYSNNILETIIEKN